MLKKVLTVIAVLAVLAAGAGLSIVLQRSERAAQAGDADRDLRDDEGGRAETDEPDEDEEEPLAGRVTAPPEGQVYWGIFRFGAPYDSRKVSTVHDDVGLWPSIMMWYQEWHGQRLFDLRSARFLLEREIVPMVTWEPWEPPRQFGDLVVDQPRFALARIAEGDFDSYIIQYALAVREFGGPVMMRPFHEMDGFWYPWGGLVNGNTPADFIAAWRHVHDIFERVGATNATWVWSVNHLSVPDTPENAITNYWPGGHYVDWIGISGFNWGDASDFSTWKTFDEVYAERYADLAQYKKPIALTEVAAPEVGGDKPSWIRQSFDTLLARYPKIKAVIWYDKRDSGARDWRIDSSPETLAAFRSAVSRPQMLSAPAALAAAEASATVDDAID